MEQLSLLAPGLVGIVVAVASVIYAHRITSAPSRHKITSITDDKRPFEFSPPAVETDAEGSIHARSPEAAY
jgi:hypothetical protein